MSVDQIKKKQHFQIHCKENKNIYTADRVILACGSKASQISGSDGSGYTLAKMLGHNISSVYLHSWRFVPMKNILRNWPESELEPPCNYIIEGGIIDQDTGELQFTDYGISGIPVFQVSRYVSKALLQKKKVAVLLDLVPSMSNDDFAAEMTRRKEHYAYRTAEECFNSILPAKLIPVLLNLCGIDKKLWAVKVPEDKWNQDD